MIPSALTPYKWAILAGAALAVGAAGFGSGWAVQGWRMGAKLSDLKAAQSTERADAADAALDKLARGADAFSAAASQAQQINAGAATKFAAIAKEFKNAKPLPFGCRPDDFRLRDRNEAIDVYNAARSGQQSGR